MPGLNTSSIGQRRLQEQNRKKHSKMTLKRPPSPYRPSPSPAPSMDDNLRLAALDSRMGKKERSVLDPRLKEYTGAVTEAEALAKMRGDHLLNLVNRKLGEGHRRKKRHHKKSKKSKRHSKKKRHHKKSKRYSKRHHKKSKRHR